MPEEQSQGQNQAQTQEMSEAEQERIWWEDYDASMQSLRQGNLDQALETALRVGAEAPLNRIAEAYRQRAHSKMRENPQEALSDLEKSATAYQNACSFSSERNIIRDMLAAGGYQQALNHALAVDAVSNQGARSLFGEIGNVALEKEDIQTAAKAWIAGEFETKLKQVKGKIPNWGEFRVGYERELEQMYEQHQRGD